MSAIIRYAGRVVWKYGTFEFSLQLSQIFSASIKKLVLEIDLREAVATRTKNSLIKLEDGQIQVKSRNVGRLHSFPSGRYQFWKLHNGCYLTKQNSKL